MWLLIPKIQLLKLLVYVCICMVCMFVKWLRKWEIQHTSTQVRVICLGTDNLYTKVYKGNTKAFNAIACLRVCNRTSYTKHKTIMIVIYIKLSTCLSPLYTYFMFWLLLVSLKYLNRKWHFWFVYCWKSRKKKNILLFTAKV